MDTEFERAISRLEGVKRVGSGFIAKCPCHHDIHQSLSITDANGKALMYCHAGCTYEKIISTLGLAQKNHDTPLQVVAIYDYHDENGRTVYQVVRYEPKSFRQRMADGTWGLSGTKPLLYHLPEVIDAVNGDNIMFFVEGEKDVDNLRMHNLSATTLSGGASTQWLPEHTVYLKDTNLAIIPDNDKAGKEYAMRIGSILYGWCKSLKIVYLPVPPKGDVSDYLQEHGIDELMAITETTPQYTPVGAVSRDEVNALKGHLIYLQGKLNQSPSKNKKYIKYDK